MPAAAPNAATVAAAAVFLAAAAATRPTPPIPHPFHHPTPPRHTPPHVTLPNPKPSALAAPTSHSPALHPMHRGHALPIPPSTTPHSPLARHPAYIHRPVIEIR